MNNNYRARLLNIQLKRLHNAGDIQDEWQTPDLEFGNLERLFLGGEKFSLDLFTNGKVNAKCESWLTAEDNALTVDWGLHCRDMGIPLRGFANPPYSKPYKGLLDSGETCTGLNAYMKKAHSEMLLGFYSLWIVPNAPDSDWFPLVECSRIIWVTNGRLSFNEPSWYRQDPDGSKPTTSRGGTCIVIFDPDADSSIDPSMEFMSRVELRKELETENV